MLTPRATIDFETRSAASLRKLGSWRYSLDPTTEVLCLAYRLPHWKKGETALWHPAFPHLGIDASDDFDHLLELLDWTEAGKLIEAHNAWFERGIWTNILVPKFGFPAIHYKQWRCSAAKAASHALPRALEDAVDALQLSIRKDTDGTKVMKKVSVPRKPLKRELELWYNKHNCGICATCKGKGTVKRQTCPACNGRKEFDGHFQNVPPMPILWHESRELFERLWQYCQQDVLAEEALSRAIPDLNHEETELYLLDQLVNERGFELDREAVNTAQTLIAKETVVLNKELAVLTKGKVKKATQRAQMLQWFDDNGLNLADTQKDTIEEALTFGWLNANVKQALTLVKNLGRSSTAKYASMENWICDDNRVHGGLLFHGATTGRWSGSGVQPHNFVRSKLPKGETQDTLWEVLKTLNRELIAQKFGSVMDALANGLRGAIVAPPGKELFVADYASIEARVLLWLANDQDALAIFRNAHLCKCSMRGCQNCCIYCDMASDIYDQPVTKANDKERQMGKQAILGLGYQMGWSKFQATCAKYKIIIEDDFAQNVVTTYREKFWRVKELWSATEEAAISAVYSGNSAEQHIVDGHSVLWLYRKPFLYCQLPSGRRLAYPFPEVREKETPWGEVRPQLTYMGIDPYNHQWRRQPTYGGMLVENIVQAISRDIMAEAMFRCQNSGIYMPILSVHDELITEVLKGKGNVAQFVKLLTEPPEWAPGCPIEAEGWSGVRYKK